MNNASPMIQLFEDAVNALIDLYEVDGLEETVRAILLSLETMQVAVLEGEMETTAVHAPERVGALVEALRPFAAPPAS